MGGVTYINTSSVGENCMKIIAFKRAKDHPFLHPEFITEYVDASLIESTEGYETMIEEHFELELAKNSERHEAHLKHLRETELAAEKVNQSSELVAKAQEKELEREFEQFKRWKLNNEGIS